MKKQSFFIYKIFKKKTLTCKDLKQNVTVLSYQDCFLFKFVFFIIQSMAMLSIMRYSILLKHTHVLKCKRKLLKRGESKKNIDR